MTRLTYKARSELDFTNNAVANIQMTKWFNQNHIAKAMLWLIESYKNVINSLII